MPAAPCTDPIQHSTHSTAQHSTHSTAQHIMAPHSTPVVSVMPTACAPFSQLVVRDSPFCMTFHLQQRSVHYCLQRIARVTVQNKQQVPSTKHDAWPQAWQHKHGPVKVGCDLFCLIRCFDKSSQVSSGNHPGAGGGVRWGKRGRCPLSCKVPQERGFGERHLL